jgi:hypothetical protein
MDILHRVRFAISQGRRHWSCRLYGYFVLFYSFFVVYTVIMATFNPSAFYTWFPWTMLYPGLAQLQREAQQKRVSDKHGFSSRDISFINLLDGNYTGCIGRNGSDLETCRLQHMSLLVVFPIISVLIFCGLCLVALECLRYRRKQIAPYFIDPKAGSE